MILVDRMAAAAVCARYRGGVRPRGGRGAGGDCVGNLDWGGVSLVVGAFVHPERSQHSGDEGQSANVVGHADAFAHIEASLAHTTPHALLVVGGAQVGKTAVMNEVARRLHLPLVRINPAEAGWPLSGLSALAAALGGAGAAAVDAEVRRERERAVPADDLLLADRLLDAIRAQTIDDVILVDDVDLMDQRSTTVLGFLMRRLGGTSLRMIASISAGPVPSEFDGVPRTVLGPLPRREAIAFARSVFPTAAPGVATLIADASGGLAGVIGTARLTPEELSGAHPLLIPPRRGDLHPSRAPLPQRQASASRVLRMLAVAPFADQAALVGDDRDRIAAVDRLLAEGVIALTRHRLRIVDTALRVELLESLDLAARTELHTAAAEAHRDVDLAMRLWHESFIGGEVGADLLVAAAALIAAGDVAAASEFAERACVISPADRLRDSALLGLAGSLCDQGEFSLARLYLSRLSSDLVPSQRVRETALSLVIDHAAGEPLPVDRIDAVVDRHLAADPPVAHACSPPSCSCASIAANSTRHATSSPASARSHRLSTTASWTCSRARCRRMLRRHRASTSGRRSCWRCGARWRPTATIGCDACQPRSPKPGQGIIPRRSRRCASSR